MLGWIALTVVVVALVVGLRMRSRSRRRRVAPVPTPAIESARGTASRAKPAASALDAFQGCMVMPQKDCCEAIQRLRGQTFPVDRVITLPVAGCDRASCECQLHRVVGRRRGPRRVQTDRRSDVRFKEDRRSGRDRRKGVDVWRSNA